MGQKLEGKIAYITGASQGIGRATAIELAKEGVNVGLIARQESKLEKVAEEVKKYGVNVDIGIVDVSDLTAVDQTIKNLASTLGTPDILINNAGIASYGKFLETDPEEWRRIFDVNVFGMYNVTRAVLPSMIDEDRGDIINISSSSGLKATAGTSAYSASKFAVQGMSEALMQEVRPHNIRVFTMNPSLVATELPFGEELDEKNDPEKLMQPEDLAEYMVAQLKLNQRIFIKQSLQWATNPF
ncbi:3-oxoacyl-[acyl-carrier protein] reductase [Alkalibacillus filiformis]|uniref:3-oxoacyl-[acyl-carrier protein] reductase n=1 Tax=Alkalibacillus filiformis TaxID=200990 RepID=A0ABU0DPL4_9BACI|nr:3-ketoacyl-ACP reductase [Alkalibacillus filiformis]MDQ0350274.1 3-oxoacyl-[acyl-carrier protein] reductase [Alkalibacillus filiformis]